MGTIRYNSRLKNLQKRLRNIENLYKQPIEDAYKDKDSDAYGSLISEYHFEKDMIEDEIGKLKSRHVLELADKYCVPRPEFSRESDKWVLSDIDRTYRLSESAILEMRSVIRKEEKEHREYLIRLSAALTGIIGALSGLIALIR